MIVDAIPYFRRWKLQPDKIPTAKDQWECTKGVLFSHFTVQLPLVCRGIGSHASCSDALLKIWLFHPIAEGLGMSTWQVPFPAWKDIALQVAFFFVYEDMFHFFGTQTSSIPNYGRKAHTRALDSPPVPPLGSHVQAHPQNSP